MPTLEPPTDEVLAAARRIRDALRRQENEVIDLLGARLGPPTPRPDREDLLAVLRYLGVPDDDPAPGDCGAELKLWGITTYCICDTHEVGPTSPHRNRYDTRWGHL